MDFSFRLRASFDDTRFEYTEDYKVVIVDCNKDKPKLVKTREMQANLAFSKVLYLREQELNEIVKNSFEV